MKDPSTPILRFGIEHQVKHALSILVDQAGKLFFLRIGPGWQVPCGLNHWISASE